MQTRSQATRERIIDAALHLFSEKGFTGATTRDIARHAGVAELTLFRHFPAKELLIEAILKNRSALSAIRAAAPSFQSVSYEESLRIIATTLLTTLRQRRALVKIFLNECSRYPEQVKAMHFSFMNELFEVIAAYFRDLQKKKILRKQDPVAAAQAFLGIFYAYFISRNIIGYEDPAGDTEESDIAKYIDIFIHGTKGTAYDKR
ncbi:MAG TPA: TetR/AcrR family transcriptional regulator [Dissulfurispiraceae bacterium]|nr:TetR/AcrR family transcriptional regulator [Dissulfurispiraceae bacterium]